MDVARDCHIHERLASELKSRWIQKWILWNFSHDTISNRICQFYGENLHNPLPDVRCANDAIRAETVYSGQCRCRLHTTTPHQLLISKTLLRLTSTGVRLDCPYLRCAERRKLKCHVIRTILAPILDTFNLNILVDIFPCSTFSCSLLIRLISNDSRTRRNGYVTVESKLFE